MSKSSNRRGPSAPPELPRIPPARRGPTHNAARPCERRPRAATTRSRWAQAVPFAAPGPLGADPGGPRPGDRLDDGDRQGDAGPSAAASQLSTGRTSTAADPGTTALAPSVVAALDVPATTSRTSASRLRSSHRRAPGTTRSSATPTASRSSRTSAPSTARTAPRSAGPSWWRCRDSVRSAACRPRIRRRATSMPIRRPCRSTDRTTRASTSTSSRSRRRRTRRSTGRIRRCRCRRRQSPTCWRASTPREASRSSTSPTSTWWSGRATHPQVLAGLSQTQIAQQLANPNSAVAQVIDGAANVITAAITQVTGQQPTSVASSPAIAAIAKSLGA